MPLLDLFSGLIALCETDLFVYMAFMLFFSFLVMFINRMGRR